MTLSTEIMIKVNEVTHKQSNYNSFQLAFRSPLSLPVGAKCFLGYMAVYFSVNGLLVMAYLIVHLVGSTLVCCFEESHGVYNHV